MDVCILAGGYGTRLKGVWDGPKCLTRVAGRPVIEHLVNLALALAPRKIFLLLGYRAGEVVTWRENCCPHKDVIPIIELQPQGTLHALRQALPLFEPPVLVLNGDTMPRYSLREFVHNAEIVTQPIHAAWCDGFYVGAAVFNATGLETMRTGNYETLDHLFYTSHSRYHAADYLDIGTPENFYRAQHMKEGEL